jgi:hypothetical protein
MAIRKLSVHLDDLVDAMEQPEAYETRWYLDTRTGKLLCVSDEITAALENGEDVEELCGDIADRQKPELEVARQILDDVEDRFLDVPSFDTRDCYDLMAHFVAGLDDEGLRQKLQIAIAGKGAFRRFRDVLAGAGAVRDQWFAFEREHKRQWAKDWLESLDIETTWRPRDDA